MAADTITACRACYDNDGLVVEAVLTVETLLADGTPAEWHWDCPRCLARVGFGYRAEEGAIDLGVGSG